MNERIKKLREQSLSAEPRVCPERARLITEFYNSPTAMQVSTPMKRALAFKYLMEHKTIYIDPHELIVGERGTAPKATPTYPEICIQSLADLDILDSREKIPFSVDRETRGLYKEEIIPSWKGKSMRDRIFVEMSAEWKGAYSAGVFTEFLEQRAPGHTVSGDKIYKKGFLDLKKEIGAHLQQLDYFNDPGAYDKKEELEAMSAAADGLICFARRHAEKLRELAGSCAAQFS
jgi:formate C-acetyltransferase